MGFERKAGVVQWGWGTTTRRKQHGHDPEERGSWQGWTLMASCGQNENTVEEEA